MSNVIGTQAPAWVRIVAAIGLVWNLIGVYFYLAATGIVAGAGDPAMADSGAVPAWVTATFAVAVFSGALGSLGLLLLKGWARLLLALSLLAVLLQDLWVFVLRDEAGDGADLGMPLVVTLIAILLFWLAHGAARKGWLS